jgi:seryl-tRNA synthetase
MIDRITLRNSPQETIELIARKDPTFDGAKLVALDQEQLKLQLEVEALRTQKNELAEQGKKGITPELRQKAIEVSQQLKTKEAAYTAAESEFMALYLRCPNIPDADLPVGGKEANKVERVVGAAKSFTFEPQHHVALGEKLGWLDFEGGAKIAGSQFACYRDDAVRMIYALTMFMLKHNNAKGYQLVLPPYVVNEKSLTVTGNLPRFKDEVYATNDDLYLIPTSEVSLTSLYRDTILNNEQLPVRMTSWTSCFRREAGGYGATERGLIRIHQFEKVELVTLCAPENSRNEQDRMIACAESILQALGLHYRVMLLASQDCSFSSARTYDLEVWLPGQNRFFEVSSVSNCTDFQARRGAIRYRKTTGAKPQLVHTLNGSSLALSRLMVALMETYQQADGTIEIPDVLRREGLFGV